VAARESTAVGVLGVPLLCLTRFQSPVTDAWRAQQMAQLTATEHARLARIERQLRREQFVVGHGVLRWALKSAGFPEATIEVDADGRVRLHARGSSYASIAHSANWVAVVLADVPVGVDLESTRPLRDLRGAAALLGLAPDQVQSPESILRAWVAAEARLKAGPHARADVWRATWEGCQVAVAGTVNPPMTGSFDAEAEIYNAAEVQWESAR
jgi:hypothetical protein